MLVTGGTGFLGRPCVELLRAGGDEVHIASRATVDLFDRDAARRFVDGIRPTHLLHLAWCTEPGAYWTSPDNARWVEASVALLRAFLRHGRRFAIAGTSAEYDWSHGVLTEDETPLRPNTPYGSAKHELHVAAEELAREAGASGAWGRLFGVYGPREPRQKLVSRVIDDLLHDRPFTGRTPEDERDLLFVADAARPFVMLLDSDFDGAVNIGSGTPVTIRRVVDTIAAQLGKPELVQPDPSPSHDAPRVVADVRRLAAVTGFAPSYTLERGIRETIEWHRGSGGEGG